SFASSRSGIRTRRTASTIQPVADLSSVRSLTTFFENLLRAKSRPQGRHGARRPGLEVPPIGFPPPQTAAPDNGFHAIPREGMGIGLSDRLATPVAKRLTGLRSPARGDDKQSTS